VGEVATRLGGGGHSFMAGFTTDDSISVALDRVRSTIAAVRG
jgi:nanoRNase/pAp phosphatase (c-di-AMP/oligoRNAs hydrolase)